jgi:hypothetical protein
MDHDPLCEYRPDVFTDYMSVDEGKPCACEYIAKIRADERKQAGQRVDSLRGARGVSLYVAAAVARGDVAVQW